MELQYHLRMLGVTLEGPAHMYGDNKSVVLNCLTPSSILKEKHLSLAYNRVHEASTAGILVFSEIWFEVNVVNVLTTPLGGTEFYRLVKPHLFTHPKWNPPRATAEDEH